MFFVDLMIQLPQETNNPSLKLPSSAVFPASKAGKDMLK